MKTISGFKMLIVMFVSLIGMSLTSCDKDDDVNPSTPVKVEDVNGNYTGKLATTQGSAKSETETSFTANKNVISFADLPIKEIVGSIIKDQAKAQAAIKTIGKVKYDLNYTASVNSTKTAVDLTFAPKALEIQVPVDGANKKVAITFSTKQKGAYKGKKLQYELTADKITVDGTAVTPFTAINYNFANFARK